MLGIQLNTLERSSKNLKELFGHQNGMLNAYTLSSLYILPSIFSPTSIWYGNIDFMPWRFHSIMSNQMDEELLS